MQLLKYFLIAIGIISMILFVVLLFIGIKVVSTVVAFIVGTVAVIAMICFIFFYIGKLSAKNKNDR